MEDLLGITTLPCDGSDFGLKLKLVDGRFARNEPLSMTAKESPPLPVSGEAMRDKDSLAGGEDFFDDGVADRLDRLQESDKQKVRLWDASEMWGSYNGSLGAGDRSAARSSTPSPRGELRGRDYWGQYAKPLCHPVAAPPTDPPSPETWLEYVLSRDPRPAGHAEGAEDVVAGRSPRAGQEPVAERTTDRRQGRTADSRRVAEFRGTPWRVGQPESRPGPGFAQGLVDAVVVGPVTDISHVVR